MSYALFSICFEIKAFSICNKAIFVIKSDTSLMVCAKLNIILTNEYCGFE